MGLRDQLCAALGDHLNGGPPRPPEAGAILWTAFAALSVRRSWHAHGPNPISFHDIDAWCRLKNTPLAPHHVDTLAAMDGVWMAHTLAQLRPDAPRDTGVLGARSKSPLSADLFDAMMG